jgi:RNA polymerase-interacting CarD/CdnL/TRCF family regulator
MNQDLHLFTNEELFLKIKNLYEWLDINDDDREKYNSFNLNELNGLYRILQKHKEYREMENEERRIARINRMQK